MSGYSDEIGDVMAGVSGVLVGLFVKPFSILGYQVSEGEIIMSIMLLICSIAIIVRKYYNQEFSEHWDYLYLVAMPLGICLGKIILLFGVL